jgi:hypothetical protein
MPTLIAILALVIFVSVRYFFFLPLAAVLAPDQLLGRSYDVSAGNSLRILAIIVGVALPVIGVGLVLSLPWLITELITSWQAGVLHWPKSFGDFELMMGSVHRGKACGGDFHAFL